MKRAIILAALALGGCEGRDWQGWVYPNRNDLTDYIPIGAFGTLNACAASSKAIILRMEERLDESGEPIRADYECGYKCEHDGGPTGLNICEKTER